MPPISHPPYTKANKRTAYLSNDFHHEVAHWKTLLAQMRRRPTYIAEIVQRLPTDLGYTDASGKGAGGVWLDINHPGLHYVWRLQWPKDITDDLVSFKNPEGRITNSDLELAALVLQEATFHLVTLAPAWRAPSTGSDTPPLYPGHSRKPPPLTRL